MEHSEAFFESSILKLSSLRVSHFGETALTMDAGNFQTINDMHLNSARGYYGPPHFVMLNSWTPWQSQGFQHSVRSLPVWVQPAIPHTIHPYVTSGVMMYTAAPQILQPVQVPNQLSQRADESCLFRHRSDLDFESFHGVEPEENTEGGPSRQQITAQVHGGPEVQISEPHVSTLPNTETAKEVKAEMEKTEPSKRGRTRKREGIPGMRKKRRTKGEADEGVRVEPQVGMPMSQLRERMTESIRVFHCLGDKTRERGSAQPPKNKQDADFIRKPMARSCSIMLPQSHESGKRKRICELGFQGRVGKTTFPGDVTSSLAPSCSSDDAPAGSAPQMARERPHVSTDAACYQAKVCERSDQGSCHWQSSPSLNGCSQNKFPFVLEESTPIQPWQREEREAMKKKAQREREQAARVTKMGLDYVLERLRYRM